MRLDEHLVETKINGYAGCGLASCLQLWFDLEGRTCSRAMPTNCHPDSKTKPHCATKHAKLSQGSRASFKSLTHMRQAEAVEVLSCKRKIRKASGRTRNPNMTMTKKDKRGARDSSAQQKTGPANANNKRLSKHQKAKTVTANREAQKTSAGTGALQEKEAESPSDQKVERLTREAEHETQRQER